MEEINILKLAEDENNRSILRNNLCYIRKYLGLTGKQLGKMIGVSKQTITNFEHKTVVIDKAKYIALMNVIISFVDSNIELYDKKLIYKMLTKEITFMETKYEFDFKD